MLRVDQFAIDSKSIININKLETLKRIHFKIYIMWWEIPCPIYKIKLFKFFFFFNLKNIKCNIRLKKDKTCSFIAMCSNMFSTVQTGMLVNEK